MEDRETKQNINDEAPQKRDSDRLGTEPVHPLLLKMSAPLMVSMFVMALYNIVDSIFLGMYSTDSLTAVSYCFPFQNLNAAFGIGTAVGMSALLSRYLGAKEYEKADKVAHNGFVLVVINYAIFFLVGCFAERIMLLMTSDSTGAQIIAGGSIDIRGTCRGLVHAGAYGDSTAFIVADHLMPTQIRISNLIARSPDEMEKTDHAERASIKNGHIVFETIMR